MLEKNFALNLTASLSGKSFSFDELIVESKSLFEREGIPGFIRVLLAFIDDFVITYWYHQYRKNCYESPHFRQVKDSMYKGNPAASELTNDSIILYDLFFKEKNKKSMIVHESSNYLYKKVAPKYIADFLSM